MKTTSGSLLFMEREYMKNNKVVLVIYVPVWNIHCGKRALEESINLKTIKLGNFH